MEENFGNLPLSSTDDRLVCLHGRVLTARRLGSVLFLSIDRITQFNVYTPTTLQDSTQNTIPAENNSTETSIEEPEITNQATVTREDVFGKVDSLGASLQITLDNVILQTVLAKESFKGEVRDGKEEGTYEINKSLKQLARTIAMGHQVEIIGNVERNNQGQLRVCCVWLKINARDRVPSNHKVMNKQDRDFQGHIPLCSFFRKGKVCTHAACPYRHEFKDERERLNAANMQLRHQQILKLEKDPCDPHSDDSKKHRHKRAELFVEWFLTTFKDTIEALPKPVRILDIAGGKGDISLLLLDKGFDCVLLEPRDHKFNPKKIKKDHLQMNGTFTHLQCKLDDEFLASEKGKEVIAQTDLVIAMHPDQATEAAVDLSLQNNKPFAVVPCCVFPNLFPRKKKDGTEVITYFHFVDYLLEKDEKVNVGYLGFQGRTKVLYTL